jgi:hypothetical protein
MDEMDVDQPTAGPSSLKRDFSSTASSADKRAKLSLPPAQLAGLNNNMASRSQLECWPSRVKSASIDNSLWLGLVSNVLQYITIELAMTSVRDRVIPELSILRAHAMVNGFSKDELERWKAGVRKCVESSDWRDMIDDCTYDYHQIVASCLIVTTAKLKIPNVPPPSMSHQKPLDSLYEIQCE